MPVDTTTFGGAIQGGVNAAAGALPAQLVNGGVGALMGLMLEKHNDQRQINQQQKLTNMQLNANEQMSAYNFGQQYDLWQKTNYPAQVQQLEKAGLNPALLYGGGGGGGSTTSGSPSGGIAGGQAPSGGHEIMDISQQVLQNQMAQAQIEQTKANTDLAQAQAEKLRNVDTPNVQAQTASISQGIENQKAAQKLTEIQTKAQQQQYDFGQASFADRLDIIAQQARQATGDATRALIQANVDEATEQTKVNMIRAEYLGQMLQNANTEANTKLTNQKTAESKANIQLGFAAMRQNAEKILQGWNQTQNDTERKELLRQQITNADDNILDQLINGIKHMF